MKKSGYITIVELIIIISVFAFMGSCMWALWGNKNLPKGYTYVSCQIGGETHYNVRYPDGQIDERNSVRVFKGTLGGKAWDHYKNSIKNIKTDWTNCYTDVSCEVENIEAVEK